MRTGLSIPSYPLPPGEPPAAKTVLALFAAARRLREDAHAGTIGTPLRGRNLALLLGEPPAADSSALHRAALDLGARVAEVRFTEPPRSASAQDDVRALARMLGRMYDAIDCGALAPDTVCQIEQEAAVPVYAGLGLDDHPARLLADLMTLYEYRLPLAPDASILFMGDPQTARGRTFLSAAQEIGFAVRAGQEGQAPPGGAIFLVDATHPPRWSLQAPPELLDDARRSENHRCVMQAVLLDTMARA